MSTTKDKLRSRNGSAAGTPAVSVQAIPVTFDPTQATAALGVTLPAGAIVIGAVGQGAATGGTNPTVHIGSSADADGFFADLPCDAVSVSLDGALFGALSTGAALAADTPLYGGVGASAATGGTFTGKVLFIPNDDGSA